MRKPGVVSIAKACGVSPSTVCRALNGKPGINVATRDAILAACKRHHYSKNIAASNLRLQKSNLIIGVMADINHELFIEKLRLLGVETIKAGFSWMTHTYRDEQEADSIMQEVLSRRPAGIVTTWYRLNKAHGPLLDGIPVLAFDRTSSSFDHVALNRERGIQEAVTHLIHRGCRSPLLLGASLTDERGRGFARAMTKHGMAILPERVISTPFGRDLAQYGRAQIQSLIGKTHFDAIVAVNDQCAIGAIRALRDAGLEVPGDVRVIGFDNIMMASHTTPALTTLSQPKEAMAEYAVKFLLNRLNKPTLPLQSITLDTSLILRESA